MIGNPGRELMHLKDIKSARHRGAETTSQKKQPMRNLKTLVLSGLLGAREDFSFPSEWDEWVGVHSTGGDGWWTVLV